ncbi:MAG: nucleotidyltransferase family protein [Lachnospiraceae bacterium]|nr:nucleotidyltransferase family protein [Lachnospiraceae bacterium]
MTVKIAGVIAECNPFHEGHRYLLEKAREITGADRVVVLLSGDFVQRGEPAVEPKEIRVRQILAGGADAVLELPVLYAASSAEYFADGAVNIFNRLGGVTDLVFGSESGSLEPLSKAADLLLREPEQFRQALRRHLAEGMTYPAARSAAAAETAGIRLPDTANDLLGMEYLLSVLRLREGGRNVTSIRHVPIDTDPGTADTRAQMREKNASDMSFANAEKNGAGSEACRFTPHAVKRISTVSASALREERRKTDPSAVCPDDFSDMLYYRIRSVLKEERTRPGASALDDFLDVTPDFADKIRRALPEYESLSAFTARLKSKDLTYTRVSRALLHVLLDIRKSDLAVFRVPGYVRLLGLSGDAGKAGDLIGTLASGQLPVIAALGRDQSRIPASYERMLQTDLFASELYDAVYARKTGHAAILSEHAKPVIRM